MAKLVPARPKLAPPTAYQLAELKRRLRQVLFIEHAAALAGIPKRVLNEWILQGRAGNPEFTSFVDMIDQQLAELSETILSPIVEAASSGNLQASTFLYNVRIKPHEERALKKQFAAEDELETLQNTVNAHAEIAGADDLAARVLEQMQAKQLPVESEKH
jgi:hypothetical protein